MNYWIWRWKIDQNKFSQSEWQLAIGFIARVFYICIICKIQQNMSSSETIVNILFFGCDWQFVVAFVPIKMILKRTFSPSNIEYWHSFFRISARFLPLYVFFLIEPCHRRKRHLIFCSVTFCCLFWNEQKQMTAEKIQSAKWQHSSSIAAINDKWSNWMYIRRVTCAA